MEAALQDGSARLQVYKLGDKPFLINNWKMLQANADPYAVYNRYVKVSEGVASITNGEVIIRCPIPLPSGFYVITEENEFVRTPPCDDYSWTRFPDVDAACPALERMDWTTWIGQTDVLRIIEFTNYARKNSRSGEINVFIRGDKMSMIGGEEQWLQLPCTIPVKPSGLVFSAYNLKLAFTEMLRYDAVQIGYDNVSMYKQPLVIGLDWGHCALCSAGR